MTPTSSLGMGNGNMATTPTNSSNLYNSLSSRGFAGEPNSQESQEPNGEANPAEVFIQRFGQVFELFQTISSDANYAVAAKEAEAVRTAFKNYMEAVVSSVSPVGGESGY